MEYRVKWEIDVDTDTPREAAERALEIMRDPGSEATVFMVIPHGSDPADIGYEIDLFDEEPAPHVFKAGDRVRVLRVVDEPSAPDYEAVLFDQPCGFKNHDFIAGEYCVSVRDLELIEAAK